MSYNRTRDAEDVNPIEPREVSSSTTATTDDGVILVNGPSVVDPGFEADEFSAEFTNNTGDRLSNGTAVGATWGIANEWTWMVWVKIDINSTSRRILGWFPTPSGSTNSFELTWSGTGGFRLRIVDDNLASLDKIADFADDYNAGDGWAQVVVTWDGTLATSDQTKAWVNGVSQTLTYTSNDAGMQQTDVNRYIRFGNNTAAFGGQMHSAAVWDVALDSAAVTTIFNGGNGANFNIGSDVGNYNESANCVAWWRLGKEGASDPDLGVAAIDNVTSGTADVTNDFGTVVRSTLFPGGGSGQVTVTLPEASTASGKIITVQDKLGAASSLPVLVGATGSDTINGETGENLAIARESRSYVSDGVNTWKNYAASAPGGGVGGGQTGEVGPTGETGAPGGDVIVSTVTVLRDGTNQTLTNGVLTELEWDTVGSDPDGWNDVGGSNPGRLTVPTGLGIDSVEISVQVEWAASSSGRRLVVMRKNDLIPVDGGRQHLEYVQAAGPSGSTVQNIRFPRITATEGDYFTVDVEQESGGNLDIQQSPNTWFVIEGIVSGGVVQGTQGPTGETGPTGPPGATGPAGEAGTPIGPDQFAIDFDGASESMASVETDTGLANTWSMLVTPKFEDAGFNENLIVVAPDAGNVNRIEIRHAGNVSGDPIIVNLWDSAGTSFKSYRWDNEDDLGDWQSLLVTWNGTTLTLYKNGAVLAPDSTPTDSAGTMTNTNRRIRISDSVGVQNTFDGRVHSAAFWNTVLTAGEASQIYDNGLGPAYFNLQADSGAYVSSSSLIHWYRLATNTSILGEDVQGTLDLDQLTGITSADVVNDFPAQPADGPQGDVGPTGPTGPTGTFDSTAALHTFGDNANTTTTLEVNSNTESRVVLADNGTDQWRIDNSGGGFRVTDVVNSQSPFRIQAGADGDSIHIDAEGDVGIGTIPESGFGFHYLGPNAKFESQTAMSFTVEGATGQAADVRFAQNGNTEWTWRCDGATNFVLKNSANDNIIGIINGVTTEAIRIDSAGEVGINNTTPQRQLDVTGTARVSGELTVGTSANAQPSIRFNRSGTDEWLVYGANTTGTFIIADVDNSTFPFRIEKNAINGLVTLDDTGVGINDLTPTRSLDVTGTGHFTDLLEADGGIDINGARVNSLGVSTTGVNLTVTTEDLVACTAGGITITLPAASGNTGRRIIVKDRDANATASPITVDGNASETIDGSLTFSINVDYQSITLVCDGSNWMVV